MTSNEQIRSSLSADGVLLATIDMPGRSMNVFSAALMDALDTLMDRVDRDPAVRSVVITSGKKAFLAGADLDMVKGFTESARTLDEPQMIDLCGRLGRQFVRLEASPKPWVAAVNGTALGGGLELAMACRTRVVADDPRALIGLPESRWGLLPGAGGTQRLPRLVGFEAGLSLLLSGRAMAPKEAVERGVFERAVPADSLLDEAFALALRLQGLPYDPAEKYRHLAQADVPAFSDEATRSLAQHHGVSDADLRDYPAYETIIHCVLRGARQPLAEASATEMQLFLRLMFDPVAGNMIRSLFLNRQRADRELAPPEGVRIESVSFGPLSPDRAVWQEALQASRLPLHADKSLPPDTLLLSDTLGRSHTVRVAPTGTEPRGAASAPSALLWPAGPYGRVMEIVKASAAEGDALAALAGRLGGALPYRSGDGASVLQRVARAGRESLDAQAVMALRLLADGAVPRVETLDVAACAAGVSPAWSGGPLTHLWAHRARLRTQFDDTLQAAWQRAEPALAGAFA